MRWVYAARLNTRTPRRMTSLLRRSVAPRAGEEQSRDGAVVNIPSLHQYAEDGIEIGRPADLRWLDAGESSRSNSSGMVFIVRFLRGRTLATRDSSGNAQGRELNRPHRDGSTEANAKEVDIASPGGS